ncbi:MAG: OmpW family protein [Rugosibacter sp.]|nr:outer membrane protein [Rugosibacter sp.]
MTKEITFSALAGALVATLGMGASPVAQAENSLDEGRFMVRVRAVNLDPANDSDAIPALGVPGNAIHVEDRVIPEIDFTYFFTKNIAAELILTYPQKHDVTLMGTNIGSFKHLPPTLTLQYHFLPDAQFRPYVGAGINYTRLSSVKMNVPGVGELDLENDSIGGAVQLGFDYKLDRQWYLNVDVKKVWISSDVSLKATGAKVSSVGVDPILFGIGVGYRF